MAEINTNETVDMTENQTETNPAAQGEQPAHNAELTKLKADLAKQKAALDKATKEAADYKRALRQHQSAEEAKAEAPKADDKPKAETPKNDNQNKSGGGQEDNKKTTNKKTN